MGIPAPLPTLYNPRSTRPNSGASVATNEVMPQNAPVPQPPSLLWSSTMEPPLLLPKKEESLEEQASTLALSLLPPQLLLPKQSKVEVKEECIPSSLVSPTTSGVWRIPLNAIPESCHGVQVDREAYNHLAVWAAEQKRQLINLGVDAGLVITRSMFTCVLSDFLSNRNCACIDYCHIL